MNIDPKFLAQLSVVIESGAFQPAADRLGLTQPGLSRNMKVLEARLGAPLFKREGRRSVPTELARKLAKHGMAIRIAQEQAGSYARQSASGLIGELRIGVPPIIAGKFLTLFLTEFTISNPEAKIELRVGLVHELLTMLERERIDFMIGPLRPADKRPGFAYDHLVDDHIAILCRSGHPLSSKASISPVELEDQGWLAHSRGSMLREQTERVLRQNGVETMHIVIETDSIRSAIEIVGSTDLITAMPVAPTKPYLDDRLVFLPFSHPDLMRPLGIIRPRVSKPDAILENFVSNLRRHLKMTAS